MDRFSPSFPGTVTAKGFVSTLTGTAKAIPQRIQVATNGTTPVDVFGTTNLAAGTFLAARTIARDTTAANITLKNNVSGTETTLCTIAKGTTDGGVVGSYFTAATFASDGTAQIVSSQAAGNALVEIDFILSDPKLPGAI